MGQRKNENTSMVDNAVAEGGAYDVIRKRLIDQGKRLNKTTQELNASRLAEFGSSDMQVIARIRVRTENNCIARDIVQVGEQLLFGYNVFIGLKKETKIEDVFSIFDTNETEAGIELTPADYKGSFLSDPGFVNDFNELYRYYKDTKLVQLRVKDSKLLAAFQIGERIYDVRVFRWAISADGKSIKYIDNRGERDIQLPSPYDFQWTPTTRDNNVNGRHPHANILDTVFVETLGGNLTIKIENNTEDGLGIYREPVEDKTQSLDDAQIHYAQVGKLILLKVRPYREEHWRYFIYNTLTQTVLRVDAIGESCVQLPEDHGIIFPGGYYLQTGEFKAFEDDVQGLKFKREIRSPNGEDVLYVFYQPEEGLVGLFAYNLIEKKLLNPIFGHGYALGENGRLVIFSSESEPTRIHPMQIWQTPYESAEHASNTPPSKSFFGRIGNAPLVRGISDLYSLCRLIDNQSVSSRMYETLARAAEKIFDNHYWLSDSEMSAISEIIKEISATSDLVIDEFEKVESIRQQSAKTMQEAEKAQENLLIEVRADNWVSAEQYVEALGKIRRQRGHLITIKEHRYIDLDRIDKMTGELGNIEASLSAQTVSFLSDEKSLEPYIEKIEHLNSDISKANTNAQLGPLIQEIEETTSGLDLLSELMGSLQVDDATIRTRIIDAVSSVYARLNQSKASANHKRKSLGAEESVAQFGAQFKLFSQSIANALSMSNTPEKCDEQLSRLLIQLEELESQFSEHDQFLSDIMNKREDIYESFEGHKQQLLDARQIKAQNIAEAAGRILSSVEKRSLKFTQADELNTYFASDPLVLKIRDLVANLREIDNAVKADEVESKFKGLKEQAIRSLRDKSDIYESGGNVIKLGPRHKFSVNTQELDLTIIPKSDELAIHITGTNYFEAINNPELYSLKEYWDISLESETKEVYRGEYLASCILRAAHDKSDGLSEQHLIEASKDINKLGKLVRDYAGLRYKEGYEKGVHDHDATRILMSLIPVMQQAELLKYSPISRAIAQLFWTRGIDESVTKHNLTMQAKSSIQMRMEHSSNRAADLLAHEIALKMKTFLEVHPIKVDSQVVRHAADYLVDELARPNIEFVSSQYGEMLADALKRSMSEATLDQFNLAIKTLKNLPSHQWDLIEAWLISLLDKGISQQGNADLSRYIPEAIAILMPSESGKTNISRRTSNANLEMTIEGLLGDHTRIQNQTITLGLDEFIERMDHHRTVTIPAYHRYLQVRQQTIESEKKGLRLHEFKPRPLSSFVRNRLINESYLPLIGANLAKQIGTIGENKRSDLSGLLMMISPPGYGKTTLMEYVAHRLGLIFMKINCPSLGHDVLSLDPQQAPNSTARQEINKINLAFEMGNNVMLYLDDIQHTHPEFLQKFISLCDGTRRVDGVWKGQTKTYDMRGKKFCVVMAGNPYTEAGEAFKVPDMLANRADIYNLGDILGGMDEQFALSYIENALTSNAILAPLALREMDDTYKLIKIAQGEQIATTDLSYAYSGAEINEITEVLKKMFIIQEVILKINKQYIASAAQNDKYRIEPPFKLQGSYRNMNKMSEKVSSVMNDDELMQMIEDHYLGEAQLLTSGAEDNLLKLAELRGNMTETQSVRWEQIKSDFLRDKVMGGSDDAGTKVVGQLVNLVEGVRALKVNRDIAEHQHSTGEAQIEELLGNIEKLVSIMAAKDLNVKVINEPVPGIDKILNTLTDSIELSLLPLMKTMYRKLDIDLNTNQKVTHILKQLKEAEANINSSLKKKL